MRTQIRNIFGMAGLLMLTVVLLGGCMTERSPIDTTSPTGLDKRLFEGEFFFKQTITDIPYTVDYSFIGETNDLRIIRWEITENWLIGYDIHEHKEYTDTDGNHTPSNVPVLAIPILDHFDRQLAENPTTGEDMPMLVANHDKPWWQRRYVEIDPSGQALSSFDMTYMKITIDIDNPFNIEPVGGYRQLEFHDKDLNPIHPLDYEMRYMAGGNQLVDTFSFYNELIVSANNSWRGIYTWSDVTEFINWEPSRVEIRNFFWKVDREALDNNGFEQMEFQDNLFKRFGYFVREYRGVDPVYGYRENNTHQWANHFNINGDNKIVYYLSPDFPERMELTACSIAADYNHVFSKAYYEGTRVYDKWQEQIDEQLDEADMKGWATDFPEQIKLQDGLHQIASNGEEAPQSLFMPDANTPWPESGGVPKLDDKAYYYLDYTLENVKAPSSWSDTDKETFGDRRSMMVAEMKRYCFTEGEEDKFVLRRNSFMPYDFERDGVNPEGLPNLITENELLAMYDVENIEQLNARLGEPVEGPIACKLSLEHRCMLNGQGEKIPRWKHELGDPRYSYIYWVDTPTEYGILGVAQWSDNPETGQIFAGSGHIAGSVLQWSVSRELERYFMLEELEEDGFVFEESERYEQLLNELIIDAEYTSVPQSGEEDSTPHNRLDPPPPMNPGSESWKLSTFSKNSIGNIKDHMVSTSLSEEAGNDMERRAYLESMELPKINNRWNIDKVKGTKWESMLTPSGIADFIYPGQTSFSEEMLYGISPMYWGTYDAMMNLRMRENLFTEKCYFQSEWLDGGFLEIIKKLDDDGYTREDIRRVVENIMFKGVAEHELGHSLGLRHNFMASADRLNYVGSNGVNKTGYWRFEEEANIALAEKIKEFKAQNDDREPTPKEKFYLSKMIPSPKDWYMYSSVMDYMDEFYYHGFGLGRWDVAAIQYVYGKVIEKYETDDNFNVKYHPISNQPMEVLEPLFENRKCSADDLYNSTCRCVPGMPEEGQLDENCICTEHEGLSYCYNQAKTVKGLRSGVKVELVENGNNKMRLVPVEGERAEVQLNGDVRPYLYCPDNWRFEEPMCNVWDKGYTARDIIRNMGEQYKRFYFWRSFRRGNPRFRRTSWISSVFRLWPMVHFALDFNFNRARLDDWRPLLLDSNQNPFAQNIPLARKEYLMAMNGIEEWTETVGTKKVEKTLTPGGPGDYLIAGMEGFNFLLYDIFFAPDVGVHVELDSFVDRDIKYFATNPYVLPDEEVVDDESFTSMEVDLRYGHYHRNHWDYQDDNTITQAKLMRRGFTIEKDAAAFLLTNTGWWVDKYAYESMANGFQYTSDGLENALFGMFRDLTDDKKMHTFSRYCAYETSDGGYDIKVFQPRVNDLYLYGWAESAVDSDSPWQPGATEMNVPLCTKMTLQEEARAKAYAEDDDPNNDFVPKEYIPIQGSWIYFDKIYPLLWGMANVSNTMADNTTYSFFTTTVIPVSERANWDDPDGITEVECLNSKENLYYRARSFPGDSRPNPIFNLVDQCYQMQKKCLIRPGIPVAPGNLRNDMCLGANGMWYPKWYLNRDLETMESTFILMNDFASFWMGLITGDYN